MARDRQRAKKRQRKGAARQPQPGRGDGAGREQEIDPGQAIPDLEHGSADADLAKAAMAAGSVDPEGVDELLDSEVPPETPRQVAARGAAPPARPSGNRVATFLRNSWEELKRVQWPDRRHVAQATGVVMGFVVAIGLFLGGADWLFSRLVDAIV